MEPGFYKADSSNLPTVDLSMILSFMSSNPLYVTTESRNVKTVRNSRESYGDEAVGRVQLKRDDGSPFCVIKAKVTPEHRVHDKGYDVEVHVDEHEEQIISCVCKDCVASQGGCKHAVALLFWLHRRSEEPSVTSVECYWNVSKLSKVGNEPAVPLRMLLSKKVPDLAPKNPDVLQTYLNKAKESGSTSVLSQLQYKSTPVKQASLHCLGVKYIKQMRGVHVDFEDFRHFCMQEMNKTISEEIEKITRTQYKCSEWFEVRYGRITASKAYEVTRCNTEDGVLIQTIFGAAVFEPTEAMKRGIFLEDEVLRVVQEKKNIVTRKCGIIINPSFPLFGASPDAISAEYCIEIKCPSKLKTVTNYLTVDKRITLKPFTQLQLQMYFCNKNKGLFCVAAPDFETSKDVCIIEVELDETYCLKIIKECHLFFDKYILKKLLS